MSRKILLVSPDGPFSQADSVLRRTPRLLIKRTTCYDTSSHRRYLPQRSQQYSQGTTVSVHHSTSSTTTLIDTAPSPVLKTFSTHSIEPKPSLLLAPLPNPTESTQYLSKAEHNPPCRKPSPPAHNSSYLANDLPSSLAVRLKIRIDILLSLDSFSAFP